ncbi:MAG: DUF1553 domain-containing protein [Bryobacteraceae bacterium]
MRRRLLFCALLCPVAALFSAERTLEFNRDIRPILSDKCYHCHGPDAVAKKIPLRLDSEAAAKADLGGRRAVVDGDAAASELVRRITAAKTSVRMPPAYSGLKLSQQEIDTLRDWIAQGAQWQSHWSFIAPKRPHLPGLKNMSWTRNAIDAFILERLEREGLTPSPEAGRETLLRRATLDLTGLPPTPAEIDAFLKDRSPDAYEKVVDRLLASPRYGERMAGPWLDAARYADSNGYQYDAERFMWRWRDWVIDAFNRNQPFDQFALEQIAGDLLPNATIEQKMATGFNRNHRANTEDGIIPEEYAVEYVVDRVETTSTVFMGLTLGCARCHNHKYDPFTQKEFYQVFAYFNNVPELGRAMKYGNSPPLIPAPTREQQAQLGELDRRMQKIENFLKRHAKATDRAQKVWESRMAEAKPVWWSPARGLEAAFSFEDGSETKSVDGAVASAPGRIGQAGVFDGKAYLDAGNIAGFDIEDRFTIAAWVYSEQIPDGPLVTRMADDPKGRGYGLHVNQGRVHVHLTSVWADDAIRLETEQTLEARRWYHLAVTYTGSRTSDGVRVHIDGKQASFKVEQDTLYRPYRNAGREIKDPFRVGGGWGPERRFKGMIDDVRVYARVLTGEEIAALAWGASIGETARKPEAARTEVEKRQLRWQFLETAAAPEMRDAWKRLAALRQDRENLERKFPTVMVMAERTKPRDTFLLIRGAYDVKGEKVTPGVPAVLPPLPEGVPNNRLGFAKWMVDPANPLTARVTVNRFWQMYFGTGLVKTTEDFGVQGEWPSHPELLDWLATEFVRGGWGVKALQKLIVTSAAYRQSSKATPELLQRDPENRLLARGPRFRLPAETIRDQALLAAGLLVEKLGGPSVKPYQPEGLWKEISMQDMEYVQGKGEDLYRRSLYTFWKRTIAPPMMANFDSAMRESCVVRETQTNTPLQALNLMNDVTFLEASRFIGQRMMREGGGDPADRLRHGFRLATGRAPSADEERILRDSLQFHLDYFAGNEEKTKEFLSHGETASDPSLDQRQLAAYASVASLILNLDETVTKE